MRRSAAGLLGLALVATFGASTGSAGVAAPPVDTTPASQGAKATTSDALPHPQEEKRQELREEAWSLLLSGRAKAEKRGASTVMKLGKKSVRKTDSRGRRTVAKVDQYVELAREKTDRIFVVLAEFGNERHPSYPDQDTDPDTPGPTTFDGPLHNAIPEPDRTVDNSTVWRSDYNRPYYQDLYFGNGRIAGVETVRQYYEKQSSGRYSINGKVTDWVKVRYNEARYGRSDGFPCASNVCSNTWNLIQDAVNQWVADQKAAGRTTAQITAELKTFDQWDRYDFDGDGNFDEPDGYIDHFQIVHAGGDQADGDPHQGEDAIWSHRWYVQTTPIGGGGPTGNPLGGTQAGDTGVWVGDYTIQPENGGVSVFTHEYGHDLGLPDLYDTSGGGENSVNWWSLMAQSRVSARNDQGIGTRSADLDAWSKLQLGWLDYEIVLAGQNRTLVLGPHEYNSKKAQGLVVVLPKKSVTTEYGAPAAGARQWWSGSGDDLNNTMSRQVTLGAGAAALTFQAKWDIEDCGPDPCDYAFVEVDDGTGYKPIAGNITKVAEGNGIDGTTNGAFVPATFDLTPYQNKTVGLRLRYQTDGAVKGKGFFADSIQVTSGGATVFTSGAEAPPEGWTLAGFSSIGASVTGLHDNFYLASHINYVSHDKYLRTGPYNFGFLNTRPDWVEHFPYQDGLLVWYWDTSQGDNNTSEHFGEGLVLPVDSHPVPINRIDGQLWRPRVGGYDAPFGLEKADSFTLHINGQPSYIRGQAGVPTFNDSRTYWYAEQPTAGVKVPNNGVNIKVLERNGTSIKIRVTKR
ncbi:immune inhibitor A domain-containing protein [Kribbella sp. NPDC002412]